MRASVGLRLVSVVFYLQGSVLSPAQPWPSADILSPGEDGFDLVPEDILIVDIFVDMATHDVWTAAGLRAITAQGATLSYLYAPDSPTMPQLVNPGIDHRLVTSLSKPRARNEDARFENAGAAIAGGYNPPAQFAVTSLTELNVAFFASPPETSTSPSVDGYLARIAIDLSGSPYQPDDLILVNERPSSFVLACEPPPGDHSAGFAVIGFHHLTYMNFWVTTPEPATLLLLLPVGILFRSAGLARNLAGSRAAKAQRRE